MPFADIQKFKKFPFHIPLLGKLLEIAPAKGGSYEILETEAKTRRIMKKSARISRPEESQSLGARRLESSNRKFTRGRKECLEKLGHHLWKFRTAKEELT